jgi:hypothetical protein
MFYLGSTPRDVEGQGSLFAGFEEGKHAQGPLST